MEETTLDNLGDEQPQQRPVFLTVLCILTWVGSGIGFLGGLVGFFTNQAENYKEIINTPGAEDIMGTMASYEEYLFWTNLSNGIGILVAALCIFGAVFMYQLKKNGFYIYLGGCVLSTAISFLAMSHLMPSGLAWVGYITVILSTLVSVAFIIMYGVNLKHMK